MKDRPDDFSAAELFFALSRKFNSTVQKKMLNIFKLSASDADLQEYYAIVQREKKANQRKNVPLHPSATGGQIANVPLQSSITGGHSENVPLHPSATGGQIEGYAQDPPPPLPPEPPTPPAHRNAPASAPAHTRGTPGAPTLAEVTSFLVNSINTVPVERRAECAQAYIDNRSSADPAWHKPPTNNRPAVPIMLENQGWHGDCRQFAKNWANIEHENGALHKARLDRYRTGSGPGGRTSSTQRPPEQRTFDEDL